MTKLIFVQERENDARTAKKFLTEITAEEGIRLDIFQAELINYTRDLTRSRLPEGDPEILRHMLEIRGFADNYIRRYKIIKEKSMEEK